MYNALATSFDLAGNPGKRLFIKGPRGRVAALISIISLLRRELYDANNDVVKASQRLHSVLLHSEFNVNPVEEREAQQMGDEKGDFISLRTV
jgi:hypothetical protein